MHLQDAYEQEIHTQPYWLIRSLIHRIQPTSPLESQ